MLRVGLGHSRGCSLGRSPKFFGDGACWWGAGCVVIRVLFGSKGIHGFSPLVSSIGFPVPCGGAGMRRRHASYRVGCRGECGMTGASFGTVTPRSREPRPAPHLGVVSVVVDQRHHTNPSGVSSCPTGGARIITSIPDGCASLPGGLFTVILSCALARDFAG